MKNTRGVRKINSQIIIVVPLAHTRPGHKLLFKKNIYRLYKYMIMLGVYNLQLLFIIDIDLKLRHCRTTNRVFFFTKTPHRNLPSVHRAT